MLFPNLAQAKGKKSVLKFEDVEIEGEVQRPDIKIYISTGEKHY